MKLLDALQDLIRELAALGANYAVVGGLAASARGEVRFTRDVDVVVAVPGDEEAERLVFELRSLGYEVLATVEQEVARRLATARLVNPAGVTCDLIFATCGVEAEVVATAEELEILPGLRVRTASVESLLAMKTLSVTPARPRDLGDIQALLRHHPDFDAQALSHLLELITQRGFAREQRLGDKWRRLRSELGV